MLAVETKLSSYFYIECLEEECRRVAEAAAIEVVHIDFCTITVKNSITGYGGGILDAIF